MVRYIHKRTGLLAEESDGDFVITNSEGYLQGIIPLVILQNSDDWELISDEPIPFNENDFWDMVYTMAEFHKKRLKDA